MLLLLVFGGLFSVGQAQIGATTCTRVTNHTFICDWSSTTPQAWQTSANPIVPMSDFYGEIPQTLNFTNVNGLFSVTPLFTGFSGYLGISYTLRSVQDIFSIDCNGGIITGLNLTGLVSYVDGYITDCNFTSFPESMFAGTNFSKLTITGGYLNNIDANALSGLTFQDTDYGGQLILDKMVVNGQVYPDGFFGKATNLKTLSLRYNDLRYLTQAVVSGSTTLQVLDLTGNHIDAFSEGMFDGLNSLWKIDFSGLPLDCSTCTHNVWLFDWAETLRIQLNGQLLCTHPAERLGMRMYTYNTTVCAAKPTIDPLEVVIGIFIFIGLALSMAAFGMVMLLKSSLSGRRRMVHSHIKYLKHWKPIHDDMDPIEEPVIKPEDYGGVSETSPETTEPTSDASTKPKDQAVSRPGSKSSLRKRPGTAAACGSGESRPGTGAQRVTRMAGEDASGSSNRSSPITAVEN